MVPSVYVTFHGPVPVSAILIFDEVDPLQIVCVPEITAVGLAATVTTALPVRSAPVDVQFASFNAVTV